MNSSRSAGGPASAPPSGGPPSVSTDPLQPARTTRSEAQPTTRIGKPQDISAARRLPMRHPPRVLLRLLAAMLVLASQPASADCEVHGVASVERLRVRVAGTTIRTYRVEALPVAVTPGHGAHQRVVRIL